MSRSSSDDQESGDRLLSKDYSGYEEEKWVEDYKQAARGKDDRWRRIAIYASLAGNALLAALCLWLWTSQKITYGSGKTEYYGASPDAEKAWTQLMDPYIVQITGKEAEGISRPTSKISKDPDYYITSLDVYHQLHCLNDIRKMVRDYNTTEGVLGRLQTMHKFHCIDSLRQSLMCNADLSLIHWYWADHPGKHFPNATTTHICRKWSKIEEWAVSHRLDEEMYDPRKFID
ncbi:Tat pathway signal sequence [Fusarium albosuccineum]|uniref:Tat pathway signal sequence n=1 Tax=Fusarium albosuccineum TaxID=1237068 RepID=A0A8H4KDI4_9HYPO|nr:Tat pathway signal sequence [Fusarium albosuccineum]